MYAHTNIGTSGQGMCTETPTLWGVSTEIYEDTTEAQLMIVVDCYVHGFAVDWWYCGFFEGFGNCIDKGGYHGPGGGAGGGN